MFFFILFCLPHLKLPSSCYLERQLMEGFPKSHQGSRCKDCRPWKWREEKYLQVRKMVLASSQLKRPTLIWSFNLMRRPPGALESRNILSFASASQAFGHNNQALWFLQSFLLRRGISALPLLSARAWLPRCSSAQLFSLLCPQTASLILCMNISRREGPVRHHFHFGPWRRWERDALRGGGGEVIS